jgi:methylated-DNA-[protein]-cysteine S-methyltransferase
MIYYDMIPGSIVGNVFIAASKKGLCAVMFGKRTESFYKKALSRMFPGEPLEPGPNYLIPFRREIEDYFAGRRKRFTQPIDLTAVHGLFRRRVLEVLAELPYGEVISYGELASRTGSPGAARAVGSAMAANPLPVVIPCHRVVASDGKLGGYSGGLINKKKLLELEGALPALVAHS